MEKQNLRFQEPRQAALLIATIVRCSPHPLPFVKDEENASYGHLAALCADRGLDLHLTHHDNLSGGAEDGQAKALAWGWRGGAWQRMDLPLAGISLCYADLPPNFSGAEAFRRALESHPIRIVNALKLSDLLTDKLATFQLFKEDVPLTWSADAPDLTSRVRAARHHPDLSVDKLFLKPRFGERGRGIYVTGLEGLDEHPARLFQDYIVQSFLETGSGIPELGIHERHDLRLIVRNGEIVLAFARMPAAASYVSNCSQGGREMPLAIANLPDFVVRFAADIDARLCHFGPRLYSLDLGIGHSRKIWIYELNTMPGIVWDDKLPENKPLHLNMHRILADWLSAASQQAIPRPPGLSDLAALPNRTRKRWEGPLK